MINLDDLYHTSKLGGRHAIFSYMHNLPLLDQLTEHFTSGEDLEYISN